jgi:hypothetical protein
MPDPDDTIARLESLAAQAPPPPSDALAGRLTADALTRSIPSGRSRSRRLPVLLPSVAVAALVLGFVLLAFGGDTGAPRTVVLQTASNATVEQDGHTVEVVAGTELPEGAVVATGPTGSITAGGVTLGPGERAVVRRGRLERIRRREARRADRAASTTTTTAAPSTGSSAPRPSATSVPPVRMRLSGVRDQRGAVGLHWTRYEGTDFGMYVVLRGEERSVVTRHADRTRVDALDRAAPAERTPYVVVVLDPEGRAVARSEVIFR